jgi:hypothetical protein
MSTRLMKKKVLLGAMSVQKPSKLRNRSISIHQKQQNLDVGYIVKFLVQPKMRHSEENDII